MDPYGGAGETTKCLKFCFRTMIRANGIYKKVEKTAFVVLRTAVPCEKRHDELTY